LTLTGVVRRAASILVDRPARFALMVRAAAHVTIAVIAMRVTSLPRAVAFASDGRPGPVRFSAGEIEEAVDAVLSARFLWLTPNCWRRALAIRRLLKSNGQEATVVFGMRLGAAGAAGHAWLERGGAVLGAAPIDPAFVPYFRYPPASASKPRR
jgi:hypothetical protein